MANCCRIYVNSDIDTVKSLIENHPSIRRFGTNPIVKASNSIFGHTNRLGIDDETVEINLINDLSKIRSLLEDYDIPVIAMQDLDGYGIDVWFK